MKALITALAVRRLTHLIIDDRIFQRQRDEIYRRYPPETTMFGYLMSCPRCMSIWAAFALLLLGRWSPGRVVANTLALSEFVIVTDDLLTKAEPNSMFN